MQSRWVGAMALWFFCRACFPVMAEPTPAHIPWHSDLKDWAYRQVVVLEMPVIEGGPDTGEIVVAATPPMIADDGRDVRVVDEQGRAVKFQWVNEENEYETAPFAKGKTPRLHFQLTDPSVKKYFVYFGNPKAKSAATRWEKRLDQLILETRVSKEDRIPKDWPAMNRAVSRSAFIYGKGPRRLINDTENPFKAVDRYIGIYRGKIYCAKEGLYGFAADADDASFLLIDGRLVTQWTGGDVPKEEFSHSGSVSLTAGIHRIEYYHVQIGGGALAKAGWKPPGAAAFELIPEEAFVSAVRVRDVAVQRRDNPLGAFFTAETVGAVEFGPERHLFTTVQFKDLSQSTVSTVALREWDFGDGAVSTLPNPGHVFYGRDSRTVTLRCVDKLGHESTWKQLISLADGRPKHLDIGLEAVIEEPLLLPDEPITIEIRCRSNAPRPLDTTLFYELWSDSDHRLSQQHKPLTLAPDTWEKTRWKISRTDGANPMKTGDIVLRIEYCNMPLVTHKIAVVPAQSSATELRAQDGRLSDSRGASVVLRLSTKAERKKPVTLRKKLKAGKPVHIVAVDDSLAGEGKDYLALFCDELQASYPKSTVRITRLDVAGKNHSVDAECRALVSVPSKIKTLKPDLVILTGSIRNVMDCVPIERYARHFHALADRIGAVSGCEMLLLAPPPTIANPGLAQDYAIAVKKIGRHSGIPVADIYSTFMMAGARTAKPDEDPNAAWRRYYRDPESDVPMYYVAPMAAGQRLIADAVQRVVESQH